MLNKLSLGSRNEHHSIPHARPKNNSKIRCTVYKSKKKKKFHKATGPFLSQSHSLKLIELAAVNLVHGVINQVKAFSRYGIDSEGVNLV